MSQQARQSTQGGWIAWITANHIKILGALTFSALGGGLALIASKWVSSRRQNIPENKPLSIESHNAHNTGALPPQPGIESDSTAHKEAKTTLLIHPPSSPWVKEIQDQSDVDDSLLLEVAACSGIVRILGDRDSRRSENLSSVNANNSISTLCTFQNKKNLPTTKQWSTSLPSKREIIMEEDEDENGEVRDGELLMNVLPELPPWVPRQGPSTPRHGEEKEEEKVWLGNKQQSSFSQDSVVQNRHQVHAQQSIKPQVLDLVSSEEIKLNIRVSLDLSIASPNESTSSTLRSIEVSSVSDLIQLLHAAERGSNRSALLQRSLSSDIGKSDNRNSHSCSVSSSSAHLHLQKDKSFESISNNSLELIDHQKDTSNESDVHVHLDPHPHAQQLLSPPYSHTFEKLDVSSPISHSEQPESPPCTFSNNSNNRSFSQSSSSAQMKHAAPEAYRKQLLVSRSRFPFPFIGMFMKSNSDRGAVLRSATSSCSKQ